VSKGADECKQLDLLTFFVGLEGSALDLKNQVIDINVSGQTTLINMPVPSIGSNLEGEHLYEGDIRAVDPATIPNHELICGGFPCQAFSVAGKRGGFEDTRGTLFYEICRIARFKRTPYLLLENVKGLLSHGDGDTFQTIIRTLDELGYDCQWQVLNSKNWGVPQNRERVIIVANLREKCRPQVFPIAQTNEAT
jgi:DNA (cytosine-5)-methyltransferase 1